MDKPRLKLSKRLKALAEMVPKDSKNVVDVGTDHGHLIINLILESEIEHAYGLDIALGPLKHASENVKAYNCESKITLLKMNGLAEFNHEANTFIIAGMGAETILDILNTYAFQPNQTILIQSNTKQPYLRKSLAERGFKIVDERFLYDNKQAVFIMEVKLGITTLSIEASVLGPILMTKRNEAYDNYLAHRLESLKRIVLFNQEVHQEIRILENYLNEVKT